MHSRLSRYSAAAVAALLLGATACTEATGPVPLDVAGMQEDLMAGTGAISAPATRSLAALGGDLDDALAVMGGGSSAIDLPAALLTDPTALIARRELRARVATDLGTASAIPLLALGKTFVYDINVDRYGVSDLTGAPGNGVRFLLYAVDASTLTVIEPLIQTGYVDLTRTATATSATARVQVYSSALTPLKVLDYSATLSGPLLAPNVRVSGFARNGTDSLAFNLSSTLTLATLTIDIDWLAEVPSRGVGTRVLQTIVGGSNAFATINGRIAGPHGAVRIEGTIVDATGGTLTVKVNNETFATIALDSGDDETPVILDAGGAPLSAAETQMLELMLSWFREAFEMFASLLSPVQTLLDLAF